MAEFDGAFTNLQTGINNFNPGEAYQKGLTQANDAQAMKYKLSDLANQNVTNNQAFQDQQAGRSALNQNMVIDPVTGKSSLNQPAALAQAAQSGPLVEHAVRGLVDKIGLENATAHAADMRRLYSAGPLEYPGILKELRDKGAPGVDQLPEEYNQTIQRNGLISTMSGQEQLDQMATQRKMDNERDIELLKNHIVPPQRGGQDNPLLPPHAKGLPPGSVIPAVPGDERDIKAIAAGETDMGNKIQNDPAIGLAQGTLQRVANVESVFNKYKKSDGTPDYSKVTNEDENFLAPEIASAATGGAKPTEEEINAQKAKSGSASIARAKAYGFNEPVALGAPEHFEQQHNYVSNELKQNALKKINSVVHNVAQGIIQQGGSPASAANWEKNKIQQLSQEAYGQNKLQAPAAPDVLNYAKTHGISVKDAQAYKDARTGGGQ